MAEYSFLRGALILLIAGLINRVLGFFNQIAMIRIIGPEGVGLFNMVFPIYIMVLVLATAGIPLAIAKLVAEEVAVKNMQGAYKILKFALFIILLNSVFFTFVLIISAPLLKEYIFPNPKVYYCFISLIPGIIIVSLCSTFRGFFQGLQQMTPTAIAQTIEQLVRVTAGLAIAYFLLPLGIEYGAVGLSFGVVLGELIGFILMFRFYVHHKHIFFSRSNLSFPKVFSYRNHIKRITNIAIPVTLTRLVATALLSVEAILIPQRLHFSGMSISQATSIYGQFIGIAEAVFFIPGVVTIALATSLVPAISDAMAGNNLSLVRSRILEAVRITLQVGIPSAFIFLLLADELCGVLFGYSEASISLLILAPSGPFLYLQQTTTGILQGLGRADVPFKNLIVSSVICIIGVYYLTAMPQLGIKGAALSVALGFVVMSILNLIYLYGLIDYSYVFYQNVFKPLISCLGMSLAIVYFKNILINHDYSESLILCISLLIGVIVYLILMLLNGGINKHDKEKFKIIFNLKNLK